jgi:hypothetical protein
MYVRPDGAPIATRSGRLCGIEGAAMQQKDSGTDSYLPFLGFVVVMLMIAFALTIMGTIIYWPT